MSILENAQKTTEEKIYDTRTEITKISTRLYSKINKQHAKIFNLVWNNSEGLTPQEVFDEYGTEASSLFVFCSGIQQMLVQANESYELLVPTHSYVINEDGTVTVGEKIAQ
jgi:hypothetical protein